MGARASQQQRYPPTTGGDRVFHPLRCNQATRLPWSVGLSDARHRLFLLCCFGLQACNIAFAKTHKTASTTMAMILVRYARRHDKKVRDKTPTTPHHTTPHGTACHEREIFENATKF